MIEIIKRIVIFAHEMKRSTLLYIILSVVLLMFAAPAVAQDGGGSTKNDTILPSMYVQVSKVYRNGDSIPCMKITPFYCYPPEVFKDEKQRERYTKLIRDVKYVFPYAQKTRELIIETHDYLETLPDEKARKRHMKLVEKGMKEQYEPTVRKITKTQGKLLVKLINRECGQTSYEIIRAYIGSFKAGMYNVLSTLFGNNLKKKYDPKGEDAEIERIVRKVESGQL